MDPEKRFHDLLAHALEVASGERQAFLDRVGSKDPELVGELRQILDVEEDLTDLRLRTQVVEEALEDGEGTRTTKPESAAPTPARVGPYRVDGRLGRGGMGEVYRGFDQRLERPVALKHVVTGLEDSPMALARLRREAIAIASLNHRAIVQVHDWVEADDGCWYVMELVEGRTLKQVIGGNPLPAARVIAIGRAVTGGLAAAHAAGILHRDLKAENVMIGEKGTVKLLDFGLAKSLRNSSQELTLTAEGGIVGTASAMSPEQVMGDRLDERSDLFSLGTLLYEAATGVSPFLGETTMRTVANIRGTTQTPANERDPEVSPALSDLIDHLLRKDPDQRPESARQVSASLRRMSAGRRPKTPMPRGGRSCGCPPRGRARGELGERRQVTVLSAAVVTGSGSALDSEALYRLLPAVERLAKEISTRWGGRLETSLGHRLVMCFGCAPPARRSNGQVASDAATRATLAAVELIERLERLRREREYPLSARIGLATGLAVATRKGLEERLILGQPLDLAERLEAAAEAGSVMADAATRERLDPVFDCREEPPVRLPGNRETLAAHRVAAHAGTASPRDLVKRSAWSKSAA